MRESHSGFRSSWSQFDGRQPYSSHGKLFDMSRRISRVSQCFTTFSLGCLCLAGVAQQEKHGRGYKAPPPTAEVAVVVEKSFNQKPMANASVVFRAVRDGRITANLETKTDPDGKAALDLLEVGSHVTVQVIAGGFATYATDFDLTKEGKQVMVKLERPRAQISNYDDGQDRPAAASPGVQEHVRPSPGTPMPPPPILPTAPPQTAPPVNAPVTQPGIAGSPQPGNPQ